VRRTIVNLLLAEGSTAPTGGVEEMHTLPTRGGYKKKIQCYMKLRMW